MAHASLRNIDIEPIPSTSVNNAPSYDMTDDGHLDRPG